MVKMPHWPIPFGTPAVDENLSRMKKMLAAVGNPQNHLPKIIHIAGTNGKGSALAFIKSILNEAGLKIHSYTTPHIKNFNERIILNGAQIDDNFLYEMIEEVRINCPENIRPTFFEGTTVAALLAFSKIPADIVLIECGMGGRLDATNIFNDIELAIITPISLDHMEFLGPTISAIALEKSFIMKKNRKTIIAPQNHEALEVLKSYGSEIHSKLFCYEENYDFFLDENHLVYVDIEKETLDYYPLPSLIGSHQLENAATTIAAIKNLENFNISDQAISEGIKNATWPGRLQKIIFGKLINIIGSDSELWIDGAHNISGANAMANWLKENQDEKINILILGKTKGRDQKSFIAEFKNIVHKIFAIKLEGEPRPEDAEILCSAAEEVGINCEIADNLIDAIKKISDLNEHKRILICGSLYLQNDLQKYNN